MTTCIECGGEYQFMPDLGCPHCALKVNVARTKSRDLTLRLAESVVWTDLRAKLLGLLQQQADKGDQRARDHMEFLSAAWPGGSGPRAHEVNRLRTLAQQLVSCGRQLAMSATANEKSAALARLDELMKELENA